MEECDGGNGDDSEPRAQRYCHRLQAGNSRVRVTKGNNIKQSTNSSLNALCHLSVLDVKSLAHVLHISL